MRNAECLNKNDFSLSQAFFISTMGCQMNEYDSDFLAQSLIRSGFIPVDDPMCADIILINTCTVRAKAEQKALSIIGRMSGIKRRKPGLILGVVGCLAQQRADYLMDRFPRVDFIMGPREINRILEILNKIHCRKEKVLATSLSGQPPSHVPYHGYFDGKVASSISVMEGCNNYCAYCIVPYVRGREISRSPDEIVIEAKNLISQGVKDITLLGQNVNSYQWEKDKNWTFTSLLNELSKLEGLLRLRFTTSHPSDLSEDLIRCFGELNNLCPHIHLPFQAGSNKVLKRMRRGYTREKYIALISKLREVRPDIAITSDVMVGFPGETYDDFEMTLDLIREVQFDGLFSFKYSDRKGTLAEKMLDKVDESEKISCLSILQTLQKQISLQKNKALEGKQLEVLVEGRSKKGMQLTGRTTSNKIANFDGNTSHIGNLVNVTIKHASLNSLKAEFPLAGQSERIFSP